MHRLLKVMAVYISIIINQKTYIIIIILSIQTIGLKSMVKPAIIENPPKKSAIIPSELMQFVKHNTYSLLIKGYSGTGKTTLSLTILRVLNIKSNFFYLLSMAQQIC